MATSRWVPTKPSQTSSTLTLADRVGLSRPVRRWSTSSMPRPRWYHSPLVAKSAASASGAIGESTPVEMFR